MIYSPMPISCFINRGEQRDVLGAGPDDRSKLAVGKMQPDAKEPVVRRCVVEVSVEAAYPVEVGGVLLGVRSSGGTRDADGDTLEIGDCWPLLRSGRLGLQA